MRNSLPISLWILLLSTISTTLTSQNCDAADRYFLPVFTEEQITIETIPYASFSSSDLWNGGDTSSICFSPNNYLQLEADGSYTMSMDIYQPDPDIDNCSERQTVLFVHGGGYAHIAGNKTGTNPVRMAMALATRGYVAVVIDYRKGWDIRDALNGLGIGPLLPGCQNCPCDGPECDDFSFVLATYRMVQDVYAAHKTIFAVHEQYGMDPQLIHYWGSSTGSVGAAHATYGGEAYANYQNDEGLTLAEIAGPLDAFGPPQVGSWTGRPASLHLLSGAIKDLSYIDIEDDIPAFFSHGTQDEAVPYCSGRILDMRYLGVGNPNTQLGLHGPGKMYQRLLQIDDSETLGHLYSYNGLFHSFTPIVGNDNLNLNCMQLRDLQAILGPAFQFTKSVAVGQALSNEHHVLNNAGATLSNCNWSRRDTSTQCQPLSTDTEDIQADFLVNIFPNPTSGECQIQHTNAVLKISLSNSSGQILEEQKTQVAGTRTLDLGKYPAGIYYLRLATREQLKVEKIVRY